MRKPRILITMHYMELGGAESAIFKDNCPIGV